MSDIDEQLLADALREQAGRVRETTEGWEMVVTEATHRMRARRRWVGGSATLVAAAAAVTAIALFAPGDDRPSVRVDSPDTTVAPAPPETCSTSDLDPRTSHPFVHDFAPDEVTPAQIATARAISTALSRCDYDGLRTPMAGDFTYDFGTTRGADATIARWKDEETRGLRPLTAVANALTNPPEDDPCINTRSLCIWMDDQSHLVVTISPDGTWTNFDALSFECPTRGDAPKEPVFADGTPDAVKDKARAIVAAATDCDFTALQGLMAPDFHPDFNIGDPVSAINSMIVAQHVNASILETLVSRLTEGAPVVEGSGADATYTWIDPADVNPAPENLCACGFRVGIAADGSWQYALAGD